MCIKPHCLAVGYMAASMRLDMAFIFTYADRLGVSGSLVKQQAQSFRQCKLTVHYMERKKTFAEAERLIPASGYQGAALLHLLIYVIMSDTFNDLPRLIMATDCHGKHMIHNQESVEGYLAYDRVSNQLVVIPCPDHGDDIEFPNRAALLLVEPSM